MSFRPSRVTVPETRSEPVSVAAVPVLAIPKSDAVVELFNAAAVRLPTPPAVSTSWIPLPPVFSDAASFSSAAERTVKTCCTVVKPERSMSTLVPSVKVIRRSAEISETCSPMSTDPEPFPRIPRSAAAVELFRASISRSPPASTESVSSMAVELLSRDTASRSVETVSPAALMASKTFLIVVAVERFTSTVTPSVSVIRRSEPATRPTPSPLLSVDNKVVSVSTR